MWRRRRFRPSGDLPIPMTVPWYREIFERGEKHGIEKGIEKGSFAFSDNPDVMEKGMEKSSLILSVE